MPTAPGAMPYVALRDVAAEREGLIRVMDESGEDYLYERRRFAGVDLPAAPAKRLAAAAAQAMSATTAAAERCYRARMDAIARRALNALLAAPSLATRKVQAVWLFGSRARGEARPESDVDLAVLCTPALGLVRAELMDLCAEAAGVDVDVLDLAESSGTLRWQVATRGTLVVEGDEDAIHAFLRRARFDAEDEEHRNRIVVQTRTGAPVWRRS